VVQLYPWALGSLLSRHDSQGYSEGILTRLHTEYFNTAQRGSLYCGVFAQCMTPTRNLCYVMTSTSNIEILECFQSKALCMIVDAPFYMLNTVIRRDLQIPTVKEEIGHYSSQYSARLSAHPNDLIVKLIELPDNRQLRRHLPNDLPTRVLE
jgi:hypothetical protein